MKPSDIMDLVWVDDPQVSPDGARVAYVVTHVDAEANRYRSAIHLAMVDGSTTPAAVTGADCRHSSPRWSPDGQLLAYVRSRQSAADGDKTVHELCVTSPTTAASAVVLASGPEAIIGPCFSPDGRWVAYTSRVRGPHYDSDDVDRRPPRRITHRYYRLNGEGVIIDRPTHVHLVPTDGSAAARDLTPGPAPYAGPSWFPDSTRLAATRDDLATSWLTTDVVVIDSATGATHAVTHGTGHYEQPVVSTDGATIAVLGYDDVGIHPQNPAVGLIDATGDAPAVEWLSAATDRPWDRFVGRPGGGWSTETGVVALVQDRGNVGVRRIDPTGATTLQVGGERTVTGYSAAAGTVALTASTPDRPAELFVATGDAEHRFTHVTDPFVERSRPVPAQRFAANSAGEEVDAWLFTPPDFDPTGQYPMLLNIHGGPFTQYGNTFFDEAQHQARAGFVVVLSNPRGSSGRHTAWGQATMGRRHRNPGTGWGAIDYDDLMAVVDTALDRFDFIDADRLGVIGGSYGGYMTSWIISHTHRFAAACSERAVNNLVSLDQSSDTSGLWHSWFGPSQRDDPGEYLAMSPITYASAIETPLLILHSDNDLRCPFEQADQLFYALLDDGKDVEYHLFPGEDHELSRSGSPIHRVQRAELILEFFTRHLQP